MQMRVMQQILAPGMQNGDETDLGTQVLWIGGDRAQGLGGGMKQEVVDHGLVLVRDRGDLLGQREDHVEILNGKEVGLAIFQPLRARQRLALRAVAIAATVVGDALVATDITLLDVSAEGCGAARLDRAHDPELPTAERVSVLLAVGRPGLAKDIRHLESGGSHTTPVSELGRGRRWWRWRLDLGQPVERAGRGAHRAGRDLQVARGRGQAAVAQQKLNGAQIGAGFQ